jgi:ribosomal protein S18 acetylase RimI-like enzyme
MRIEAATEPTQELLEALHHLLPQLNPKLRQLTMEKLQAVIADPAATLLVVRDGDAIKGVAVVLIYTTPSWRKARIEDVVIDESVRGHGAGRALVERCVELAREGGADVVELQSAKWREAANRLYPSLGFELRESNLYRITF